MPLLLSGRPAPLTTGNNEFLLEPLRASHVLLDYEAVMETRARLRRWSLSAWPEDDFSVDANLEDLEMHEREHEEGAAFTYTILTPDRATCLGCVYIKPLSPLFLEEHAEAMKERPSRGVRVAFWVRESRIPERLDYRVLRLLQNWFAEGWSLDRVVFFTSQSEEHQHRLFEEAELVHRYSKKVEHGWYLAYA